MDANVVTPMLTLFRSDEPSYQPLHPSKSLQPEDGDPQASLENLKQLGLVIQEIWARKGLSRILIQFATGEQYVALGLRNPAALAFLASNAGFGDYHELESFYARLPADYDGKLPAVTERHGMLPPKEYDDAIPAPAGDR